MLGPFDTENHSLVRKMNEIPPLTGTNMNGQCYLCWFYCLSIEKVLSIVCVMHIKTVPVPRAYTLEDRRRKTRCLGDPEEGPTSDNYLIFSF